MIKNITVHIDTEKGRQSCLMTISITNKVERKVSENHNTDGQTLSYERYQAEASLVGYGSVLKKLFQNLTHLEKNIDEFEKEALAAASARIKRSHSRTLFDVLSNKGYSN